MPASMPQKQVNIRVRTSMYQVLEAIANQEHRSVPQAALLLLEESVQRRLGSRSEADEVSAIDIAGIALAGGAFRWLESEPDLYDDSCGEPG